MLLMLLGGASPARWTLRDAVDAAWARAPDQSSIAAQRQAALERARAARAFFPNAPTLTGTYFDDHAIGSNEGYTTYQAEASTPVWLPGEGTATERVANSDVRTLVAQTASAKLVLAASVLDAAAIATLAQHEQVIARARLSSAQRIAAAVSHASRVGESPAVDLDAVEAEADSAVVSAGNADADAANAIAALATLTGSEAVPQLDAFGDGADAAPATANELDRDPRILVSERKLESAREQLRLVQASPMADPEIGVDGIREKQFGSPWDTRFGVTIHIPLPSRAINRSRIASAQSAVAIAEGELLRMQRQVQLEIVQTSTSLRAARGAQAATARLARELDRRASAMERAWRVGEAPLIELLRARQAAFDADSQNARADISSQVALLRTTLATGAMP